MTTIRPSQIFYEAMLEAGMSEERAMLTVAAMVNFDPRWNDPRIAMPGCDLDAACDELRKETADAVKIMKDDPTMGLAIVEGRIVAVKIENS